MPVIHSDTHRVDAASELGAFRPDVAAVGEQQSWGGVSEFEIILLVAVLQVECGGTSSPCGT